MKRLMILLALLVALPAAGQVAGGAPVFGGPSGAGSAVITTNEFDASAIVSGTLNPDRIASSTNQYLQTPTLNNAAFTGTTTVNTLVATNLAGNASGLTNIIGDGRVTTATNVWIGGASTTEIPFVSSVAPNGATNGVGLDTDGDLAWDNTAKTLLIGGVGGVGWITTYDTFHDDMASLTKMHDGLFNTRGITFSNSFPAMKWYYNGTSITVLQAEQHNSYEPIFYWGGYDLSAQAFLVGGSSTNGPRLSFLFGELGHSWNFGSPTNGSDWSSLTAGTSAASQRNQIGYSSASNYVQVGHEDRYLKISGSSNSLTMSTNGWSGEGYFPHGAMWANVAQVGSVTATPTVVGSWAGSYSSRFGVNTTTGRMTNDVAGLYEIHYSFAVTGDEITPGSYTIQAYTNNVACAPTVSVISGPDGYTGIASRSVVLFLPAATWCEVRFSANSSLDAGLANGSFYIRRL